jgi:acyl carrier protein
MKDTIIEEQILAKLMEIQPVYSFESSVDFVEMGYLDSFDIITLIAELEDTFSVLISAMDIVPENFSSVRTIRMLIEKSEKKQ